MKKKKKTLMAVLFVGLLFSQVAMTAPATFNISSFDDWKNVVKSICEGQSGEIVTINIQQKIRFPPQQNIPEISSTNPNLKVLIQGKAKYFSPSGSSEESALGGNAIVIKNFAGTIEFKNLKFSNCALIAQPGQQTYGAAIYACKIPNITINNCTFENCKVEGYIVGGGAVYLENCQTVNVNNCTFNNCATNVADQGLSARGGAIYIYYCPTVNVSKCIFNNCTANSEGTGIPWGGAIYALKLCPLPNAKSPISNCTFKNCTASTNGGVIYCREPMELTKDMLIGTNRFEECGETLVCGQL